MIGLFNRTCMLFIILAFFTACEPKPIDIDVNPAETKLVISSQIIPQKTMLITVTRSFSALAYNSNKDSLSADFAALVLVKNALVTVSYFGQTDTLKMLSPGLYASTNTLQYAYGAYSLFVKDVEKNLEVNSVTNLLPQVKFDTVYPKITKQPNDTIVNLHAEFTDNINEENYYVLNYVRKVNKTNSTGLDNSSLFANGSNSFQTYFDLLNDDSFTNGKFIIDKKLDEISPHDSIAITLSNISKSYYEFLSTYKRSGSFFNQLTGEPINYPSNINNGYGFFNANYPDIKFFDLGKF